MKLIPWGITALTADCSNKDRYTKEGLGHTVHFALDIADVILVLGDSGKLVHPSHGVRLGLFADSKHKAVVV